MTISTQKADSFISMVLGISGRVRAADLGVIPGPQRVAALRDYFERHCADTALYVTDDDELVAGSPPAEGTAVAKRVDAPPEAPDAGVDAIELDWLLGDYDAGPSAEPCPGADGETEVADTLAAAAFLESAGAAGVPSGRVPSSSEPVVVQDKSRIWLLWWVPTLLVPLLGGFAAWVALRDTRFRAAQAMFAVGLVAGVIASLLFLRFAEPIAGFVTGGDRDTLITLPSSTAPSGSTGGNGGGSGSGTNGL